MGSARWSSSDWDHYSARTSTKSRDAIFESRGMRPEYDPKNIKILESLDSDANPQSTPIIVALDVTGSMGKIPEALIKGSLGTFIEEVYNRKPVTDPHLMFMGVGDAFYDAAPLQATQFEADLRIAEQLASVWLEGRGGGNDSESYHLPWYFAGLRTKIDSMPKRGKKGYLFTIGDECVPDALTQEQVKAIVGDELAQAMTSAEMLAAAQRLYHVFHLTVVQSSTWQRLRHYGEKGWRELLGQNLLPLADHTKLAEVIVSAIQVVEGADRDAVAKSWGGDTSLVVANAVRDIAVTSGAAGALTRF